MATNTFQCMLITPEGQVFDGQVDSAVVPAHDGEIGILFNRAPLLCKLGPGCMRVRQGVDEQRWFIDAGFAQVLDNKVVVLTQQAKSPEEIDRPQAEAALAEAQHMKTADEDAASRKAQALARARALLRLAR